MGQLAKFIKKISFCREPNLEEDCDCENFKAITTMLGSELDQVQKELDDERKVQQKLRDDLRKGLL